MPRFDRLHEVGQRFRRAARPGAGRPDLAQLADATPDARHAAPDARTRRCSGRSSCSAGWRSSALPRSREACRRARRPLAFLPHPNLQTLLTSSTCPTTSSRCPTTAPTSGVLRPRPRCWSPTTRPWRSTRPTSSARSSTTSSTRTRSSAAATSGEPATSTTSATGSVRSTTTHRDAVARDRRGARPRSDPGPGVPARIEETFPQRDGSAASASSGRARDDAQPHQAVPAPVPLRTASDGTTAATPDPVGRASPAAAPPATTSTRGSTPTTSAGSLRARAPTRPR